MFLFLSFSCTKNKNNSSSDSSSSDSVAVYINKAQNSNFTPEKRIRYSKKAFSVLENQDNNIVYRKNLYAVTQQFYKLNDNVELKKTLRLLLEKSTDAKDTLNMARYYSISGNQNINLGINDSAYYYLLKSEKLFLKLKDSIAIGQNFMDKAFVQLYVGDFSGCEVSAIQSLNYYKNSGNKQREYDAYNLIGISSNELKNYENALVYHKKALKIVNENQEIRESKNHFGTSTLNNIGYVYQYLEKHQEAIVNFSEALQDKTLQNDNPALYAMIVDNLAYSKFKMKDYSQLPGLFYQALKIRESNNLGSSTTLNKIHLSEYYASIKDTFNSQKFATEALEMAKTNKVSTDLLISLKQIAVVEKNKSGEYGKQYIKISDSIREADRKVKDRFARIQFETDEIIKEKDSFEAENRNYLYYIVGIISLFIVIFLLRSQRSRNRELAFKQKQQEANEEIFHLMMTQQATIEENRILEKKKIAQDLHDGILGRMFGTRMNLDSMNSEVDEKSINERYGFIKELKKIEQDIREISHDLSSEKAVIVNNFESMVTTLFEEQNSTYEPNLKFTIENTINWDLVNNTTKINVFRILQESLQNINKYADAKNINIEIKKDIHNFVFKIVDDGKGFDVLGKKKGIGLQNMISRTNSCGGVFDIISGKDKGTTVNVTIPIEKTKTTI